MSDSWFTAALEMVEQSQCPICGNSFSSVLDGRISCSNCARSWEYFPHQPTTDESRAKSLSNQPLLRPPPISNQVLILDSNRIPIHTESYLGPAIHIANSMPSAYYLISGTGIIHKRVGISSEENGPLPVWDTMSWEDFFGVRYGLESST